MKSILKPVRQSLFATALRVVLAIFPSFFVAAKLATAQTSGGDISRKRKLLEQQKKGKKCRKGF